jgi:hypothetical protein
MREVDAFRLMRHFDIGDDIRAKMQQAIAEQEPGNKATNPKDAIGSKKVPIMSVVPWGVIGRVALGLLEGAIKYGRHNYRIYGVRASVYVDATLRHMARFWEGEDLDPDSKVGLHHIDKALASLTVLRDAMLQENWHDDRPPRSEDGWVDSLNDASGRADRNAGTGEAAIHGEEMILFIDTETTGLLKPSSDFLVQPGICQLAALRLERYPEGDVDPQPGAPEYKWLETAEFNELVNPETKFEEQATKTHGINADMVQDKPTFFSLFPSFASSCWAATRGLATTSSFDKKVLAWQLERYGFERNFPWPPKEIDVMKLAKITWRCRASAAPSRRR